jgi:hypothetical protein
MSVYAATAEGGPYLAAVAAAPPPTPVVLTSTPAGFNAAPWTLNAVTATAAGGVGPDGTGAPTLITATATNFALVYKADGTGTNRIVARAKAGTAGGVYLRMDGAGYAYFNLATGVVITNDAGVTPSITGLGGGWYRIQAIGVCSGPIGFGLSDLTGTAVTNGVTTTLFDLALYAL